MTEYLENLEVCARMCLKSGFLPIQWMFEALWRFRFYESYST
jgi:hypothetical protein